MAPEGGGGVERETEGGDAREGGRGGVGHKVTAGVLGRAAGTKCAQQNVELRPPSKDAPVPPIPLEMAVT